jgi:hypothetical protein
VLLGSTDIDSTDSPACPEDATWPILDVCCLFCGTDDDPLPVGCTCPGGCDCGDPGCDACTYGNDCCACADAVAHISWRFDKDAGGGPCDQPGFDPPLGRGAVTFPLCDRSATDSDGTLYFLADSGVSGTTRVRVQNDNGMVGDVHIPCKGGTSSSHTAWCTGGTVTVTLTVSGC